MRRGALIGLAVNVAAGTLGLLAALAHAYFDASAVGTAIAATTALSAPGTPAATVAGALVSVTWSAASVGRAPATSYDVERLDSANNDLGEAICSPVAYSSGTPNASGTFTCSDVPGPGTYQYVITAHYGQSWTTDATPTNLVTVTQGTKLALTSPATSPMGSSVAAASLPATLSGATGSVSGTITYRVFGPQASAPTSCTSGGTTLGTAAVSGNGTYTPSSAFTPSATGTYWWYASYGGDGINTQSASTCGRTMASTVVKYAPQATVAGPAGSSPAGAQIPKTSFSLALSGAGSGATGTMYFYAVGPQATAPTSACTSGKRFASATAAGNGTYTASTYLTPTVAGTYWLYATYPGDGANFAAATTCGAGMTSFTVGPATPTMTTTVPSSAKTGQSIATSLIYTTFSSSTYSGTNATGTITFTVFPAGVGGAAPTDCSSGGTVVGTATVTGTNRYYSSAAYAPPSAGNYYWQATYSGDANNNSVSSVCGSSMPKTTVSNYAPTLSPFTHPFSAPVSTPIPAGSIASTLGSAAPNASGSISWTLSGPSASANCTSNTTGLGTTPVNGPATYNPTTGVTPATPGDYWWTVAYSGDSADNAVGSTCSSHEMTVWGATTAASGTATSGTSVTSSSFTVAQSTTYLVLFSRDSGATDGYASLATTGLSTNVTAATAIGSQNFNTGDFEGAYYFRTSSTVTGTGTLTVTFANALGAGQSTQLLLVALGGVTSSAPSTNLASFSGSSTSATAGPTSAITSSLDASLVLLSGDSDLGASAPTASGLAPVAGTGYLHSATGSLAAYLAAPGQVSPAFSPFTGQGWGTLGFELKHG